MRQKRLIMLSLGPGALDLLSLRALKAIEECNAICVPTKSVDCSFAKSITYKLVQEILEYLQLQKEIIPVYTPMRFLQEDWKNEAEVVMQSCEKFHNVVFVTLGDAAIYSSVYYILEIIKQKDRELFDATEVIPGITSFSAASAKVKKALCLGDEALHIEPINPRKKVAITKVFMRPKLGMSTKELGEGEFYTFENLYLEDAKISPYKIEYVQKYMTLFIRFAKRVFS